jgi:succinate-semialdehyde dehydrogenase/glutarate-semialdehyde dehydrogenase
MSSNTAIPPLRDASLLRKQAYINGAWIDGSASFAVHNPANGAQIASVPNLGQQETQSAIDAAAAAFPAWSAKTAKERAIIMRAWFDLMIANADDLAALMTAEQGKPLAEAKGEVVYGASFIEWFAEEAKRIYGEVIPSPWPDRRLVALREPVGVVAAITPWNFPIAMITRKAAPALAVGCTVVVKPAEDTPLCALALAELADRAGMPKGVFNVVTSSTGAAVGGELTGNPLVRKLSFTGSTQVGRILMAQCAPTVKKVSFELGGNAPFIVFDDADLDAAVIGALASKYRNTGQTCVCANRLLVQDGVYDAFARKLAAAVDRFVVGPSDLAGVQQGPLINAKALAKVESLMADALAKGAHVLTGGRRHPAGDLFYTPTVLTDATDAMDLAHEEIFGPVAALIRFSTEDEALRIANRSPFGLAAYFYSRDPGRIRRVSEGLESGMIGVNEGLISTEVAPFGGIKQSGIGREGGRQGVEDFLETKYVCYGPV